jgi:hypothetical protein
MPDDALKQVAPASVIKAISPHPAAVNERRRHRERQEGRQGGKRDRKKGARKSEDRVTITGRDQSADAGPGLQPIAVETGTYHGAFRKGKGDMAFPSGASGRQGRKGEGSSHPSKKAEANVAEASGPSEDSPETASRTSRIDIRI